MQRQLAGNRYQLFWWTSTQDIILSFVSDVCCLLVKSIYSTVCTVCGPRRNTNLLPKQWLHQQQNVVIYLLGISRNVKLISVWTCVSRILMQHSPFIGNRVQSFFPWTWKEEEIPPSLSGPTCTVISLLCGFMWWSAWKRSQSSTTKPCWKSRQEIRKILFRNFKLHEVKHAHCNSTCHTSTYASNDHAFPSWAEWANILNGKMHPDSACSTVRRTTNISQSWTKGCTKKIEMWKREI